MTLLDSTPPKPPRPIGRLVFIAALVIGVIIAASYFLWDYPEERAVSRFLTAVERGDYQTAYRLWQPSASYGFADFMHGWGPQGDYGKVTNFEILDTSSASSQTVLVTVTINHQTPPLQLLVNRKTKGLAYSPY